MRDPSRVRVGGPLKSYVQGFRGELELQGYARGTVVLHLQLMGHLSRWLFVQGLDAAALFAAVMERYLVERRSAGYVNHRTNQALKPLLGYLRQQGVPVAAEAAVTPAEHLLAGYAHYLRCERGLAETTIRRNVDLARPFLARVETTERVALERLNAGAVTGFVLTRCREVGGKSAPRMLTALRSLLVYLHVEGLIDAPLDAAVPSVAAWKLTGLPKALGADQVTALLASCDQDTVVGRRDLAISRCWSAWGCGRASSRRYGWPTSTGGAVRSPCGARETAASDCRCPPTSGKRSWPTSAPHTPPQLRAVSYSGRSVPRMGH